MCGIVEPMNETNDDRELYYLYVLNEQKEVEHVYEHVYKEEIINYVETGEFQYNEMFGGLHVEYVKGN
jgi:hypothetical protein